MESITITPESLLIALVSALWIMLPAYIPNSVAAVAGGGRAIDNGRVWADGRRIFGDGKTWRGLFIGITGGIALGLLQIWAQGTFDLSWLPVLTVLAVTLLAAGALIGDLAKSFIKRRLGKERGDPWIIADQYDLVAGAFLLLLIFDYQWVITTMTLPILIWILILTPILHKTVNIIGYLIGVKEVPW